MTVRSDLLKASALIDKWSTRARELAILKVRACAPYVRNWRGDLVDPHLVHENEVRHVKTKVSFTPKGISVVAESEVYCYALDDGFWKGLRFSYADLTGDDDALVAQWAKEAELEGEALLERKQARQAKAEENKRRAAEKRKAQRALREREEYERLKQKFGDGDVGD